MLDDCRNTASPRAESCDWLVLSDWSHWLDRISRPFQALDVARRVQVTWLAISSTPLAVNSVVLDFQSSKIKSHVYKVLLNSIYDASKDLWPSICPWSTTWQRKKKQTEALGVNCYSPFQEGCYGGSRNFRKRGTVQYRKWSRDRKWSPKWTASDPQSRPQMIPKEK